MSSFTLSESEEDVDGNFGDEAGQSSRRPGTPTRKRRYRNELSAEEIEKESGRQKKYQVMWEELPAFKGWLGPVKNDPLKAHCKACDVTVKAGKSELMKHGSGKSHKLRVASLKNTQDIAVAMAGASKNKKLMEDVKEAELILAAIFAEHNVAFLVVDHLIPALKKAFKDSEIAQNIQLGRTKCSEMVKNVLAKVEQDRIVENIKQVPFSVLMDGSTDITSHKNLCVVVKYVCPKSRRKRTELLELIEIDARDCSAAALYEAFKKSLLEKGIPLNNIIGYGCDNENTMTGEFNSVWSRLKADVPHAVLIGCGCHSAASTASLACAQLPSHLDDIMSRVASYVSGSGKRQATLLEFQQFFDEEEHRILKLSKTRWLCRHQCVTRLLEQWDVLIQYFSVEALDEINFKPPKKKHATEILTELKNPYNKAYFLFLEYALNFFNKFNAMLQSEKVMIHRLRNLSIQLLKELCQNYLQPENLDHIETTRVDDPRAFVELSDVYLGPACKNYLENELAPQYRVGLNKLTEKCLNFYVTAAKDLKERLPSFTDKLFDELRFIDPEVALFSSSRRGLPELRLLTERFKELLHLDVEALALEWRTMPQQVPDSLKQRLKKLEPDDLWYEIANMKTFDDKVCFPELTKLANCAMSLPHSNADSERIFVDVTDVRCKKRNSLGSLCLSAICVVRSCFRARKVTCFNFKVLQEHFALHNQHMYSHIN